MTIAIFKKLTLYGRSTDKESIMTKLQHLGCVHLCSINPQEITSLTQQSTTIVDEIKKCLNYLKDSPEQARPKPLKEKFEVDNVVANILDNQQGLREAVDKHDFLQERIQDLTIWGNFIFPNSDELGNIRLWFYKIKYKDIKSLPNNYTIQEIHRDDRFIYLVVLAEEEPPVNALPSQRVHTGKISLKQLKKDLNEVLEKIDDLHEERRQLTRYRLLLASKLNQYIDQFSLDQAHQKTLNDEQFFLLQGWVPESKLKSVQKFCDKHQLGMSIESPVLGEKPPTLLQTYPWTRAGIELVNFYQTPSYYAFDPSLMIFFSFSIFFAMILADAGYGLVIAGFTLLFWKRLGKINAGTWIKPLLITICAFSIFYGVILGSYFGIEVSHDSFLGKFILLNIKDFSSMMKLVIAVGCLHIIAANAMRAWFARNFYLQMQSISFIILIIACMFLAVGILNKQQIIIYVSSCILVISIIMLMTFASDLPVTNFKSFMKRVLHGLEGVSHISALFGDILSYLRLFALGLAGASLAVTFNQIAVHIAHSSSYGWILGILVLIAGQTLNFALCIMGAVIHGLRLNYIEFLKWSIKEEGYSYAPFKKMEVSNE